MLAALLPLMMLCASVAATGAADNGPSTCSVNVDQPMYKDWISPNASNCLAAVRGQIELEVTASLKYLLIAAHFSTDKINRPGFAKFFFEAASEEREHAKHLIEYMTMRGVYANFEKDLKTNLNLISSIMFVDLKTENKKITEPKDAIEYALRLEKKVTDEINEVIKECETPENDHHLVDYLITVFLEEQYKGMVDLARKLSTLSKLIEQKNGAEVGLFLIDKKLLDGHVF